MPGMHPLDRSETGLHTLDLMMPFYGDPALFRLAVQSVLDQDDPRWRLVVIDDLYPDTGPGEWVIGLDEPRITYIRNEVNLGVSGNFRKCTELATAEFTTIVGCDDLLRPNYVSRIHKLLDDFPDADFVQPGVSVMDASGHDTLPLADRVKGWYRPNVAGATALSGEPLAASLLAGAWTYFPSIAWRTARLRRHGFRTDLDVALDLALMIDIVATGGRLVLDDVPSFQYRRHSGSVSSWKANDGSRFIEESDFFAECAQRMTALHWSKAARIARRHLSSRLNALTRLPSSIGAGDRNGTALLLRHVIGRATPSSAPIAYNNSKGPL
ncbi:glycosyltransferase family 2 protein [Cryobacterium sp. 5B3]|uniref:glycosyltransferase family 2 protein n=3 Tax=unclassified Cryobacterium TaxID=2649013 RepID=UPI002AB4DB68|nr:glycosyltransferase [Cryobacterium sp. 5B3]MDY7542789.1 glycosyltransferase [Cryobacterium sp. 5B3]